MSSNLAGSWFRGLVVRISQLKYNCQNAINEHATTSLKARTAHDDVIVDLETLK